MDEPVSLKHDLVAAIESHNDLGWLLQDVHRLLSKCFDARTKSIGLTRAQWRVLAQLLQSDGRTQTELAELVNIEKAPLGRMLDKLEGAGWIYRELDSHDRRVRRVYATNRVDPCIPLLLETTRSMMESVLAPLEEHHVGALKDMLSGIRYRLRRELNEEWTAGED